MFTELSTRKFKISENKDTGFDLILALDVSADSRYIVAGLLNGKFIIWDTNTCEQVCLLNVSTISIEDAIIDVKFMFDSFVATLSQKGVFTLWTLPINGNDLEPAIISRMNVFGTVMPLVSNFCVYQYNKIIAGTTLGAIVFMDLGETRLIGDRLEHRDKVSHIAMYDDRYALSVSEDGSLRAWDTKNDNTITSTNSTVLFENKFKVRLDQIGISPDRSRIIISGKNVFGHGFVKVFLVNNIDNICDGLIYLKKSEIKFPRQQVNSISITSKYIVVGSYYKDSDTNNAYRLTLFSHVGKFKREFIGVNAEHMIVSNRDNNEEYLTLVYNEELRMCKL